jgi:hypothetical protein
VFIPGRIRGTLKSLAVAVGPRLGITSALGGVLLDIIATVIVFMRLLVGLRARRATARRMRSKLDQVLLGSSPGYAFVKGIAGNMQQSEEIAKSFVPVLVTFGEYRRWPSRPIAH